MSTIGRFSEEITSFKVFTACGDSKFCNGDVKRLAGSSSQSNVFTNQNMKSELMWKQKVRHTLVLGKSSHLL